ncbi:MAG: hypothetical protein OQK94_09285 [Gammaproteobacteria bacterium]|nr:hypothetical protein [Gammaproteobacteria bacterium]MCW8841446.1 hypothetical protein [Gammaproteobacteria bacterium]MCW8991976.1 hypothetical protein [Gammaproteobacteria bacterium]
MSKWGSGNGQVMLLLAGRLPISAKQYTIMQLLRRALSESGIFLTGCDKTAEWFDLLCPCRNILHRLMPLWGALKVSPSM